MTNPIENTFDDPRTEVIEPERIPPVQDSAIANLNFFLFSNKIIKKYGAVSIQCCMSMVNNLSKISKSKVCISITGIAGPSGGTKQKPVGLVYIGIKIGKKVVINKCNFKNKGRIFIQKETVKKTLNLLIKLIRQDS